MEHKRTWIGWLCLTGMLVAVGGVLLVSTLSRAGSSKDPILHKYESTLRTLFSASNETEFEPAASGDEFIYRVRNQGKTEGYAVQQTVQGYAGPIEVITAVSPDGVLQGVHAGGEDFRETEGLGSKVKEPDFLKQFRGKQLPVTLGENIDAVAGATRSSQAVVDAVNQTLTRLQTQPDFHFSPIAEPEEQPRSGKTANASVIGYNGPVLVRLTLDDQGAIAHLDIGGARFLETEGVGSRVKEESFVNQFTGLVPPLEMNQDVDAVSGATASSQAVVDAVNEAAAFLAQNHEPSDTN